MKELIWFTVGIGFGIYIAQSRRAKQELAEERLRREQETRDRK